MQNKRAFSFVEIIVTISIIALLAVIAMSYNGNQEQKAKNVKTTADILTLNNSLQTYLQDNKSLPDPKGNINYFSTGSEYRHDATDAFAVHGFVTQDLLPKKYLNYLPLDPRTNQYYAYGKTINGNFYEVAGVISKEGNFIAKVSGNYTSGESLPYSLIREYDGPEFVEDNSRQHFPYNPEQRLLVAKISSFSGSVTITGENNSYLINNEEQILEHTIVKGDTVTVSAGGEAYIFYSDGSQSTLGDSSKESKLVFANMEYKEDNNLLTKIQLALNSGTLWTKATKLNSDGEKSDFEVYTQDTEAAVRGTIFGVNKDSKTKITLKQGIVAVKNIKNSDNSNIANLSKLIENIKKDDIKRDNLVIDGTLIEEDNGESVIKVTDPNNPKTIEKDNNSNSANSSTSLSEPQEEPFTTNINFSIDEFSVDLKDNNDKKINLVLPIKSVKKKINSVLLIKDGDYYLKKIDKTKDILSFTGGVQFEKLDSKKIYKQKRSSLFLKNVSLGSYFPINGIILENSKVNLFLCKYKYIGIIDGKNNGILKCSGKKSFSIIGKTYDLKKLRKKDILEEYKEIKKKEGIKSLGYVDFNSQKVKIDKDLYDKGYKLYAYAPYDTAGDIDLYKEDGSNIQNDNDYIIYGCTKKIGNNHWDYNCSTNMTLLRNTNLRHASDFGASDYINNKSFAIYSDGTKGIYIDNRNKTEINISGKKDFLKYSNLDLGNNFAIEMSVLGSDLMRDELSYLFQFGTIKAYIYHTDNKIVIKNNNKKIEKKIPELNSNEFYKVQYIQNGKNINLKIIDKNGDIKLNETGNLDDTVNLSEIYIGSKSDKSNQWNGIIDYIKFYKQKDED